MSVQRIDHKEINIGFIVGRRLRFLRQHTCSQAEFGDLVGEIGKSIQSYELGYRTISVEVMLKVLMVYRRLWEARGVSVDFWTTPTSNEQVVWKDVVYYLLGFMPKAQIATFEAILQDELTQLRLLMQRVGYLTFGLDAIDTSWTTDYTLEFPTWIKHHRKEHRLMRSKFAKQVGLTVGSLKQWEEGYRLMSIHAWLRIMLTAQGDLRETVATFTNTDALLHVLEEEMCRLSFNNLQQLEQYLVTGEVA